MRLSADRVTAARILMRVEDGAFASRLLSGGATPATRARVLEVLRSMMALDAVLERFCRRKLNKLDAEVRAALRVGLVEAMRLDVPAEVATDSAVHLVRRLGRASAASMVNAVLRKATTRWRETIEASDAPIRFSHPRWIYERWIRNFGEDAAQAAMASAQESAVTWVWFRDGRDRDRLRVEGVELVAHPWCPGAWSAPKNVARLIDLVSVGSAYAQDPTSQLVAHAAAQLTSAGSSMIDLCAAPGGKSALLLALGSWRAAVAADLKLNRTRLMRPVLEAGGNGVVVTADAEAPPFGEARWDLVLLDAPCSGTGTFRRHPELKWRLQPKFIDEAADRQRRLLTSALKLAAPGGALLYATCSVEPEENEAFVANLPGGFELEELAPHLPVGVPWVSTTAGGIRILPNPDGDGFTMHAIRKTLER